MSTESYRILEFDKVRDWLATRTLTGFGRERAERLLPLAALDQVHSSLAAISQMSALVAESGRPPLGGLHDLREPLKRLQAEGTWLRPEVLLQILESLAATAECRAFFDRVGAPAISGLSGELVLLPALLRQLRESIGPRGELLDSASFQLGELRREIRSLRERIKRVLEKLLHDEQLAPAFQEQLITERNDRYVLPVRADRRGQVKGFVHDESASGQTLFVEPAQTLELNNELRGLQREEQRESERILLRLATAIRAERRQLLENQQRLAELDYLQAAARFALLIDAQAPQVSAEPGFEIHQARHPLLLQDRQQAEHPAVAIDLEVAAGVQTLIISGPNTGGKTVALKTVGLLHLMVAAGLHVPCLPESRFSFYRQVLADIGDEQSIEESLSTYSGHLLHQRNILEAADGRTLVLLDEIGTGTDPHEGGALALAILDRLQQAGATTVATTHLNLVKGYALLQEGVENAAVEFDRQTNTPTYRLHYGIPGGSGALEIARRMGFPEELLQRAETYRGEDEQVGGAVIAELNRLSRELSVEREQLRQARLAAEQAAARQQLELQQAEQEKQVILRKARESAAQLVKQTEAELQVLLSRQQAAEPSTPTRAKLTGDLRSLRQELSQPAEPVSLQTAAGPVEVGELVRFLPLATEAEVARIDGDQVELSLRGKKLRCKPEDLRSYQPRRYRKSGSVGVTRQRHRREESFLPKLVLVGARVDDALPRLEKFLDDALLHRQKQVEVVHGAGEGILRRAVREFLSGNRAVTAFHAADINQGGDNVTVVELGD